MAYVMHRAPYVFPLVGCRKVEHLRGNIGALTVRLSEEDIAKIEGTRRFDPAFPIPSSVERNGMKMVHTKLHKALRMYG
jgi:diketogulonate reductase-like aldo/keto reductase